MLSERRISLGEINRYLGEMHHEISELEERLASLRTAAGSQGATRPVAGRKAGARRGRPPGTGRRRGRPSAGASQKAAPVRRRRRSAVTPEQLASRKLQGRYLGLIRQIPANKRGQYQKIAKERGREAAVREMAQTLGK